MSAQLAAHGRLGGDPRAIETREQLQVVVETILSARSVARQESSPTSRQGRHTSPQRDPAPVEA